MPVYNITVDDSSPMVVFSPGWVDSNASDPQLSSYSGNTFHVTEQPGATATFSFFGNAIYLFGAMRAGYGQFSVSLDGQNATSTAAASGNGRFQQNLYHQTGISNGDHTLVLTNDGSGTSVDIDFITFTTGDGDVSTQPTNSTLDDTSSLITYGPSSLSWETTSSFAGSYFNGTLHTSQVQGAQAIISFTGDTVSIYGATSIDHGTFSVKIDDRDAVPLNGSAPTFRAQNLLYWAGGLHSGQHTLTIANTEDQLYVDLDDVVATSWSPTAASASPTPTHVSTAKTPIIAGVISGTCVGIAWIVAGFLLLRRRRRRRRLRTAQVEEAQPEPFILPPDPAVLQGGHQPGEYAFGNGSSRKPLPPRPVVVSSASATSAPQSQTPSRSTQSQMSPANASASSSHAVASTSTSRMLPNRDAPSASSPTDNSNTANTSLNLSATELSASRMVVPNRPQDWGPVPLPHNDDDQAAGLPPDYQQATQPMPRMVSSSSGTG